MNGYIALWKGQRTEVYAGSLYGAKLAAIAEFEKTSGRRKVKSHDVSVYLAEKNGEQVTHIAVD